MASASCSAFPGVTAGAVSTGSSGYVASLGTATFGGTISLGGSGTSTTLTISVTTLSGATTQGSSGALAFVPAGSLRDLGGNGASGTFTTASGFKLF